MELRRVEGQIQASKWVFLPSRSESASSLTDSHVDLPPRIAAGPSIDDLLDKPRCECVIATTPIAKSRLGAFEEPFEAVRGRPGNDCRAEQSDGRTGAGLVLQRHRVRVLRYTHDGQPQ
jgi:hypothetical protein